MFAELLLAFVQMMHFVAFLQLGRLESALYMFRLPVESWPVMLRSVGTFVDEIDVFV